MTALDLPPVVEPRRDETWASHRQTASSAVFLAGDRAYKLKRPVTLPFLDFSQRDVRERACRTEVALNRRLAPDVYLGVGHLGTDQEPGEPMVVMRRLPVNRQLDRLLRQAPEELSGVPALLGRTLAEFHLACVPDRGLLSPGSLDAQRVRWQREAAEIEQLGDRVAPHHQRDAVRRLGKHFLSGRAALFGERVDAGWIRDGHGDLRCEHVYLLDEGPRIIDCLDFDPALRTGDVLADLAFLVMDLEWHGARAMGEELVDRYDEFSGEHHPRSLLDFYIATRALVRAKVEALSGSPFSRAGRFHVLARAHLERALPLVVMVGGLPGSGKSTIAAELATARGAVHLSTDEIRRELFPDTPAGRYGEEEYAPIAKETVYDEMFRRAAVAVARGESVVLDASFADEQHRVRARELTRDEAGVPVEVRCWVSEVLAAERLALPREGGSDADAGIRAAMTAGSPPGRRL